ncbi:MAG: hypothetical protein ACOY46_09605 [Bacillota bacterium]
MEWALSTGGLRQIKGPLQDNYLEKMFGKIQFTRLYFGQEFCEKLIPAAEDITGALEWCSKHNMEFTLVTPYVTEEGIKKLTPLFKAISRNRCEVVANDWGVLYLLRKQFPRLVPVMGRLLNKAIRDPRINQFHKDSSADSSDFFRRSSASSPYLKSLLNILKVARVETDNLPQGIDDSLAGTGLEVSLYIPYGFISTGRICLSGSWGLRQGAKFLSSGACSRLCRHYLIEMCDRSGRVESRNPDWEVFQKGNTVFYRQSEAFVCRALEKARTLGFSRVIYQPEPL